MPKFTFVIDTEQYAGNFEREMTAYVTGHVGECGVGEDEARCYLEQTGREPLEFIENRLTGQDCQRPTEIVPTPGWFNHGMGGHFKVGQEEAALKDYLKEVEQYGQQQIKAAAVAIHPTWTVKAKKQEIDRQLERIEDAKKLDKPRNYPAYMSVGIFCSRRPNPEEIDFMKARAKAYVAYKKDHHKKYFRGKVKITGYRLLKVFGKKTEESV